MQSDEVCGALLHLFHSLQVTNLFTLLLQFLEFFLYVCFSSTMMDIESHSNGESSETYHVMLGTNSLQKLISTSDFPTRRSNVRTIIMCTDHVSMDSQEDDGITDMHNYSNGDSDTKYFDAKREDVASIESVDQGTYWSCLLDQQKFTSALDLAYLTEAMK